MTELLVSDVHDAFERRKHDISDVDDISGLFEEWCDFVNKHVYEIVQNADPERVILESTFSSITSGNQSLPTGTGADFGHMLVQGAGVFEVKNDGTISDRRLSRTWRGTAQRGYFIKGNSTIEFTNIDQAETFIMRYVPEVETIDADTDYFTVSTATGGVIVIDATKLDSLLDAIDRVYTLWDEVPNDEILADQRYLRAINRITGYSRRTPGVYSIGNYNHIYSQ